jgi:hypothetical protein
LKIIFIGTTGVHHALVAAHLLSGWDCHGKCSSLAGFGDKVLEDSGKPFMVYEDGEGTQIYSLGVGKDVKLAERAIGQFIDILGFKPADYLIEPVSLPEEKLLWWLIKMPDHAWLRTVNSYLADKLIKWHLKHIIQSVRQAEGRMGTVSCYD